MPSEEVMSPSVHLVTSAPSVTSPPPLLFTTHSNSFDNSEMNTGRIHPHSVNRGQSHHLRNETVQTRNTAEKLNFLSRSQSEGGEGRDGDIIFSPNNPDQPCFVISEYLSPTTDYTNSDVPHTQSFGNGATHISSNLSVLRENTTTTFLTTTDSNILVDYNRNQTPDLSESTILESQNNPHEPLTTESSSLSTSSFSQIENQRNCLSASPSAVSLCYGALWSVTAPLAGMNHAVVRSASAYAYPNLQLPIPPRSPGLSPVARLSFSTDAESSLASVLFGGSQITNSPAQFPSSDLIRLENERSRGEISIHTEEIPLQQGATGLLVSLNNLLHSQGKHQYSPPPSYQQSCDPNALPTYQEATRHRNGHRRDVFGVVYPAHPSQSPSASSSTPGGILPYHDEFHDVSHSTSPLLQERGPGGLESLAEDLAESEGGYSTILDAIPHEPSMETAPPVPVRFVTRCSLDRLKPPATRLPCLASACNKDLVRQELNRRWPFILSAQEDDRCPGLLLVECTSNLKIARLPDPHSPPDSPFATLDSDRMSNNDTRGISIDSRNLSQETRVFFPNDARRFSIDSRAVLDRRRTSSASTTVQINMAERRSTGIEHGSPSISRRWSTSEMRSLLGNDVRSLSTDEEQHATMEEEQHATMGEGLALGSASCPDNSNTLVDRVSASISTYRMTEEEEVEEEEETTNTNRESVGRSERTRITSNSSEQDQSIIGDCHSNTCERSCLNRNSSTQTRTESSLDEADEQSTITNIQVSNALNNSSCSIDRQNSNLVESVGQLTNGRRLVSRLRTASNSTRSRSSNDSRNESSNSDSPMLADSSEVFSYPSSRTNQVPNQQLLSSNITTRRINHHNQATSLNSTTILTANSGRQQGVSQHNPHLPGPGVRSNNPFANLSTTITGSVPSGVIAGGLAGSLAGLGVLDTSDVNDHVQFYLCGRCVSFDSFDADLVKAHIDMECPGIRSKWTTTSELYLALRAAFLIAVVLATFLYFLYYSI